MGGGISKSVDKEEEDEPMPPVLQKLFKSSQSSDDDESTCESDSQQQDSTNKPIDIPVLIQVFKKLSYILEVKEDVAIGWVDEILCPRHSCFESQFKSVAELMGRNAGYDFTPDEVLNFIKYVEVHQNTPSTSTCANSTVSDCPNDCEIYKNGSKHSVNADTAEHIEVPTVYPSFSRPKRCDEEEWTASIRSIEKKNKLYVGAPRLLRLGSQAKSRIERRNTFYSSS